MTSFEYTAIPAPSRGEKAKEAKTPTDRYALALTAELNRMAADGWEYLRSDVLPSEERSGLTGRATVYHNLLIFRRAVVAATDTVKPQKPAVAAPPVTEAAKERPAPRSGIPPASAETQGAAKAISNDEK